MKVNFLILALLFQHLLGFAKSSEPIEFIENKNQWEAPILYKACLPGGALFLTKMGLVYNFYSQNDLEQIHELKHKNVNVIEQKVHFHSFKVNFIGANSNPMVYSENEFPQHQNYFIGNDSKKWASNVPLFEKTSYKDLYPGIDLAFYSKNGNLKYDFLVAKNADASKIKLVYEGTVPKLLSNGNLLIKTSVNEFQEMAPYAYQIIEGKELEVKCNFELKNNELSYTFPEGYNKNAQLVIDPVMLFRTYSGSTAMTFGWSATYDLTGKLYSGGECFATGWPVTIGAFQTTYGAAVDASINVYSPNGSSLIYSTYYGGSAFDTPNSLVTNSNNELIICGTSQSTNLATSTGCYDATNNGMQDIYVAHFDATGSTLIGATYVGGSSSDGANNHEVNVDNNNDIIVASNTASSDFPTTASAYQATFGGGIMDGCFFKLNPDCSILMFSTFLGGTSADYCKSVKSNSVNEYIVCGETSSTNYPTTAGTLNPTALTGSNGFISILNPNASSLIASTYIGTSGTDGAYRIQLDIANNVYVCGTTDGTVTLSSGVYSNPGGGVFIQKLDPTLSTSLLLTQIGSSYLQPAAFLLDVCENVYVSCLGASTSLPLTPNAYQTTSGGFWLGVLSPGCTSLSYATYMGASGDHIDGGSSRFDPQGIVYQSVCTSSGTAYTFPTSYSPTKQSSSWDVASFKFNFEAIGVHTGFDISPNDSICLPDIITFTNTTSGATSYLWDFGDGSPTSTQTSPSHAYTAPGVYKVKLIGYSNSLCNSEDSSTLQVSVFGVDKPIIVAHDTTSCDPNKLLDLQASVSNLNSNMTFHWEPSSAVMGSPNSLNITVNPLSSLTYTLTVTDSIPNLCHESETAVITITLGDTTVMDVYPKDTTLCFGDAVQVTAIGGNTYSWSPDYNINSISDPSVMITAFSKVNYEVVITDIYGCSATKQVVVDAYPKVIADAGPDEIIRFGDGIQLQGSGGTIYNWAYDPTLSNTSIFNPLASPIETKTTYFLNVENDKGCEGSDSVTIYLTNGIVPNAFSPNNDGKNDIFRFYPANDYINLLSLKVYDRWGRLLFVTDKATDGWNGTFNGVASEIGTYFYYVEYSIGSKKYVYKGDLTLLR